MTERPDDYGASRHGAEDERLDDEQLEDEMLEGVEDPGEDMDLLLDYLHQRLDPDRVALVRQRLADEPEFRDMAAPLLWAWDVTRQQDVRLTPAKPMPREELERHWDEFTKRAGFVHQRRKARKRRLTIVGIVLVVLGTAAWLAPAPVRAWYHDWRHYVTVPAGAGWVEVGRKAEARLAAGTTLRIPRVRPETIPDLVKLVGTAEFRIHRPINDPMDASPKLFRVATQAGLVTMFRAVCVVTARGDTTLVEVLVPPDDGVVAYTTLPTRVHLENERGVEITVREGQRARMVKGQPPEVLR